MSGVRTIGIIGLARSGRAAARLALARGEQVFVSDAGDSGALRDAAAEIRGLGGDVELGGHTAGRLSRCDLLVVSPGVPPTAGVLQEAAVRRVRRISELEFAWRALTSPVIAVTGTNGKSTTTALTAHVLRAASLDAPAAGNIGMPLSEVALQQTPPDWVVVECSSFQLADTDEFAPRVGIITNLSPDHLDRYDSVETYYADKARLFRNALPDCTWVLNGEDAAVRDLPEGAPGRRWYFRTETQPAAGEEGAYVAQDGRLILRFAGADQPLLASAELRVPGRHNQANVLAAALAATAAGVEPDTVARGLRTFGGLEHRLEIVADQDGIRWINDSKATNVASTRVALRSMDRPVILLLGGKPKNESFRGLLPDLGSTRVVIAYGDAAPRIVDELQGSVHLERVDGSFEEVMERAAAVARPGEVVLLSPACASFDMFRDYEDRGRRFRSLAQSVTHG